MFYKFLGACAVGVFIAGCGGEGGFDPDTNLLTEDSAVVFNSFEDVGNTFKLLSCFEAAEIVSSDLDTTLIQPQIELFQSPQTVREIVGKPRHLIDGVWMYGVDPPIEEIPFIWDYIPTVSLPTALGVTAFSGGITVCDDSELPFLQAANGLFDAVGVDHTTEVPPCSVAAQRIAARVELGMSISAVRRLVGKPVEVNVDGLWRYSQEFFDDSEQGGTGNARYRHPVVQFGNPSTVFSEEDLDVIDSANLVVTGYWTPITLCAS